VPFASVAMISLAFQSNTVQAQTYCDDLRNALTNGSNERYLADGEFTAAQYRSVVAGQRAAMRQACANTAEARKIEIAEQALSRGVPIETYQQVYAACGPWSSRKCTEDTVRSMFDGAQSQTNSGGEAAADLAASFLTGLIGGLGAGAIHVPHSAPVVGVARPSMIGPRVPMIAHASPTYIPSTTTGQTVARPASATPTVKPVTASSGTGPSTTSAPRQGQGCAALHANIVNGAVYYQQRDPGAQAADLARYNSMCGQ